MILERAESHALLQESVRELCRRFPPEYWRGLDRTRSYPEEFVRALTEHGYLAVLIPEEYGGAGLGITEASIILEEINRSGGNATACHAQMYTMGALLRHGNAEQRARYLPAMARGALRLQAFAVTEPQAGSETTRISTMAVRHGDRYVVRGQKTFTSRVKQSDLMMLLARTTPYDELVDKTEGLSLFLVDIRAAGDHLHVEPIETMVNHHTAQVFFDDVEVTIENLIGEEGKGFRYILDGWNAERILIAAEAVGDGRWFIERAAAYARDRVVFGRPIGANQGVQFPIAEAYAHLEAADLVRFDAGPAVRRGRTMRGAGQHGQVPGFRSGVEGRGRLPDDPRRLRVRRGLRCGAQVPGNAAVQDGAGEQQPGPGLPGPACPGPAAIVLRGSVMTVKPGWEGRFFEDFEIGDVYRARLGRTITDADNVWFSLLTNNTNQIHFNADYARRTGFDRPLVNSVLTLAIVVGLGVPDISENGFALGWDDIRLPNPVYAGDTVYSESEVVDKRESRSQPQRGIVKVHTRGVNQDGKVVIEYTRAVMVWKRAHAPRRELFPGVREYSAPGQG